VERVSTKKHIRAAPALSLNSRQGTSAAGGCYRYVTLHVLSWWAVWRL